MNLHKKKYFDYLDLGIVGYEDAYGLLMTIYIFVTMMKSGVFPFMRIEFYLKLYV